MTDSGLVSVVIPTKGRPEMLRRAVVSVLEQTYAPLELIVVDDGSTEPAREAIADIEHSDLERLEIRRHEDNQGGAAARNTGLQEACGEYVAFLDDDDAWLASKVERQVTALREAGTRTSVAFVGNRQLDADGEVIDLHIRRADGDVSERILYGNYVGSFSGLLVERDALETVGELDERFPAWQDWEYYVRLAQATEFVAVPEPLVRRYIDHEDRISPGYAAKREVAPLMFEECLSGPAREHGVERRVRGSLQARLGRAAWLEGQFGAARAHYARAIRIYPFDRTFWIFLLALSGGPYTMRAAKGAKTAAVRARHAMEQVWPGRS
jgi:glycosyltransferase involved in cell wall biosynthesis